jgi:hypothetical protein
VTARAEQPTSWSSSSGRQQAESSGRQRAKAGSGLQRAERVRPAARRVRMDVLGENEEIKKRRHRARRLRSDFYAKHLSITAPGFIFQLRGLYSKKISNNQHNREFPCSVTGGSERHARNSEAGRRLMRRSRARMPTWRLAVPPRMEGGLRDRRSPAVAVP